MATLLRQAVQRQTTKVRSHFVARALREHDFHIIRTAKALKVQRSYLYHLINRDASLRRLLRQARLKARLRRTRAHA